ncbi:YncE family protein [Dyadobacter bucti]|jgi:YVTN family beta-propeller protein|uniref:YncE family protein n=1 Tax=Dyadobacter bucti TaxID=2572203 RepID=UPI001109D69D|nr:YncE family protein [Dyadobacter bucti]
MLRITNGAMLLLAITSFSACRKHVMDDMTMEKNIDYPAAYVVNGEDATVSVIRLSDNNVSETLELMDASGNMVMWPHHVYHLQSLGEHRLTIAVPGMDLSGGHAGGMAGMKGKVIVMDAVKGTVVKNLEVPVMNHNAVYSADGKEIWTSQMDMEGKVLVYDAATYTLKNTISVGMEPAEVTFSPDGSKVYVANSGDDNVSVINPSSKAIIATIAVGDNPVAAWIGYDGKMYVDNEEGQSISVIDVATDKVIQTITLGFMPGSAAHLAKKEELWVTDPDNGKVHYWKWDGAMKEWMHGGVFGTAAGAHAVGFTADGNTAYVTNQMAQSVSVINTLSHTKIKDIAVGKKPNGIVLKQ